MSKDRKVRVSPGKWSTWKWRGFFYIDIDPSRRKEIFANQIIIQSSHHFNKSIVWSFFLCRGWRGLEGVEPSRTLTWHQLKVFEHVLLKAAVGLGVILTLPLPRSRLSQSMPSVDYCPFSVSVAQGVSHPLSPLFR